MFQLFNLHQELEGFIWKYYKIIFKLVIFTVIFYSNIMVTVVST